MFTEEQLKTLREGLPYDATKRIKSKLWRTSKVSIAEALNDPTTKRIDILIAAVEVAEEHKQEMIQVVNKIEELAS